MTKMKKALTTFLWSLITVGIIILLVILFVRSCGAGTEDNTIYARLNRLAAKNYSVKLSVSVSGGGKSLSGNYSAVTADGVTTIEYSYEQYSTFIEKDGVYIVPDSYKTVYSGSIKAKDGVIIERGGDAANIPLEAVTLNGITFEEGNFSDVSLSDGAFSGRVVSVEKFYGTVVECDAMNVSAEYTEQAITRLKVTFTDDNVTSVLEYTLLSS